MVGALPLPRAADPSEVAGLILVPAAHIPLEVAGQLWPERRNRGEGVGIRHPKSKQVPKMSLSLWTPTPLPELTPRRYSGAGCVLGPSPEASALWSCPWAGDRVTVSRQPPWEQRPTLQVGDWGPLPARTPLAIPAAPGGTILGWHCTNVTLSTAAVSKSCRSTRPSSSTWGWHGGGESQGAWRHQHCHPSSHPGWSLCPCVHLEAPSPLPQWDVDASSGCAAVPWHVPGQVGGAGGVIHDADGKEAWAQEAVRRLQGPAGPQHPSSPRPQGTGTPWLQDGEMGQSRAERLQRRAGAGGSVARWGRERAGHWGPGLP